MEKEVEEINVENIEDALRRKTQAHRFKIIMDAILILVLLGIGFYIFHEIETFKILGSDVCRLCMEKTGANCLMQPKIIP